MCSFALCLCVASLVDPDDQLRSLVEKHQKYLDSIRTLEVEVRADVSPDGGKTWKRMGTVKWRKDADRQRFTGTRHGEFSAFKTQDMTFDFYTDRHESRVLDRTYAPLPDVLGPTNKYGQVNAAIQEPAEWVGFQGPPIWLAFEADQKLSLSELYRIASTRKLLGKVTLGGVDLWGMELVNPETNRTVTLFLDPARSYAIVKKESRVSDHAGDGKERVGTLRVLESKEVRPGLHFPTHVQGGLLNGPNITDVRVLSIRLNERLSEDAFKFTFPAGARVRNSKTGEVHIWGNEGPALTFDNADAFAQWEREQLGYGRGRTLTKFVLLNAVLVAVIVLIVVVRKRYARRVAVG